MNKTILSVVGSIVLAGAIVGGVMLNQNPTPQQLGAGAVGSVIQVYQGGTGLNTISKGEILIGSSTPNRLMSVSSSSLPYVPSALTKGYFYAGGSGGVAEATSTIFSDGVNIGIGTTAPGAKLDIQTAGSNNFLKLLASSNGAGYVYGSIHNTGGYTMFGNEGSISGVLLIGSVPYASILTSQAATALQFGTDQTARLTILPTNGNVGIGTTAPNVPLNLYGTGDVGLAIASSINSPYLAFRKGTTDKWDIALERDTPAWGMGAANDLGFIKSGASSPSLMLQQSTGNVGIGTSTPLALLDIAGSCDNQAGLKITNKSAGVSASATTKYSNNNSISAYTGLSGTGRAVYGTLGPNIFVAGYTDSTAGITLMVDQNGPITFGTGSAVAERMRITGTGNVGIGTISPTVPLQVVGTIRATNYVGTWQGIATSSVSADFSFTVASSSFVGGWPSTGSSSNRMMGYALRDETWSEIGCYLDSGTSVKIQFGDGTNWMPVLKVGTALSTSTVSTNNTFFKGEKRYYKIGSQVGNGDIISCSAFKNKALKY